MFFRYDIFRYRYISKDVRFIYVCIHTCFYMYMYVCTYIYIYVCTMYIFIFMSLCVVVQLSHLSPPNICGKFPAWWTFFVCPDGLLMTWKFRLDMNPGIQSSWNPPEPTGLGRGGGVFATSHFGGRFQGEAQPLLKLPRAKLSYIRKID